MNKNVDFYFDFSSNYSYLGAHRIERLARRIGLDVRWKPVALGAIFKALGMARGMFGAPTFFWGNEMFWGGDRIELMGRMIEAAA